MLAYPRSRGDSRLNIFNFIYLYIYIYVNICTRILSPPKAGHKNERKNDDSKQCLKYGVLIEIGIWEIYFGALCVSVLESDVLDIFI